MTQTPIPAGQALPADAIERGKKIYDEIMAQIDPELVTDSLPTLDEKYKDETAEEAEARRERYNAAFAEYDVRYAQYMTDLGGKVKSLQRTVRAGIENDDRQEEQGALQNLESSISSS
jgi:hypothetical protein